MNSTLVYRLGCLTATLSLALLAVVVSTATGNAVAVPAWSYWTNVQAGKNVVRANPQRIDTHFHATTVQTATCKGSGAAKTRARKRVFARFDCQVTYHDDELDTGGLVTPLVVTTSKTRRGAIQCWSRSSAGLAKSCRP